MTGGALLPVLHGMSEVRSWAESWDDCLILSPSCLARAGYVAGDVGLQQGLDVGFSNYPSPRCGLPLHGMSEGRSWAVSCGDCLIFFLSCLTKAGYVAGDAGPVLQQGSDVGFSNCPSLHCGLPGRPACPSLVCQMVGAR